MLSGSAMNNLLAEVFEIDQEPSTVAYFIYLPKTLVTCKWWVIVD